MKMKRKEKKYQKRKKKAKNNFREARRSRKVEPYVIVSFYLPLCFYIILTILFPQMRGDISISHYLQQINKRNFLINNNDRATAREYRRM